MHRRLHRWAGILGAALSLFVLAPGAGAQSWPSRPLRFIVGFPPGGGSDAMARAVGARLADALGQQVVIDNKPGANGNIGAEIAAKEKGDGYTLLLISVSHAINATLYAKLGYDLQKDFVPVASIGAVPNTLVVHPGVPAANVAELVAQAKAKPGAISYASSGSGSPEHLAGELFKTAAGVNLVHVPYKGSGQSVVDLLAGHVPVGFNTLPSVAAHVRSGKLKLLAVTTATRNAAFPDVPTLAESGLPGFNMSTWYGVLAPAGTPPDVVQRLNAEINRALAAPDVREKLAAVGADVTPMRAEEFARFVRSEIEQLGKVVKATGARVE